MLELQGVFIFCMVQKRVQKTVATVNAIALIKLPPIAQAITTLMATVVGKARIPRCDIERALIDRGHQPADSIKDDMLNRGSK